jgi:hypothetical protein
MGRYARDKELATERGFASVRKMRAANRRPRSLAEWLSLPGAARNSRAESDAIVRHARASGRSVEELSAQEGLSSSTVDFWFHDALLPRRGGRTRVKPADRALRIRTFISGDERVFVAIKGSRATAVADEANATQWLFVHGKVPRGELAKYDGVRVGGRLIQTDPDVLIEVARRGEFDPEDLYRDLTT